MHKHTAGHVSSFFSGERVWQRVFLQVLVNGVVTNHKRKIFVTHICLCVNLVYTDSTDETQEVKTELTTFNTGIVCVRCNFLTLSK